MRVGSEVWREKCSCKPPLAGCPLPALPLKLLSRSQPSKRFENDLAVFLSQPSPLVSAWDNLYIKCACVCERGGVEKWPFPSLGGRGSPLLKWAESPHRKNLNEKPGPSPTLSLPLTACFSLSHSLFPSFLPPFSPLFHPASYLMMQQIIPLTYSRGLHFMIMNFTLPRMYVSSTCT